MGIFNKKQNSSANDETPATLPRVGEVLHALEYPISDTDSTALYLDLTSCRVSIRQTESYIEIIGGAQQEDGNYDHVFNWAEQYNADNLIPKMLATVNEANRDVHLFASYRIPTAWGYTNQQIAEQVSNGLHSVDQAISDFRSGKTS